MFKEKVIKGLICLGVIGMLASSSWAVGKKPAVSKQQAASKEQKGTQTVEAKEVEPTLIWKKTFEYPIRDFSIIDEQILVNTEKWDGDKIKAASYLLGKEGRVIKEAKNEGIYNEEGKIVWKDKDKGNLRKMMLRNKKSALDKIKMGPLEIEWPIYSPSRIYIAVVPGYEANYAFLKVYDVQKGTLLWEYKTDKPVFLTASFCSDEKLVVYTEGKVILYDTKSGEKYWEKQLLPKGEYAEGDMASPPVELTTSKNGEVAILFNYSIYLPDQRKWEDKSKLYSLNNKGDVRWEYERPMQGSIKISSTGKFVLGFFRGNLLLFDSNTGEKYWEKKILGVKDFITNDKYILTTTTIYDKKDYIAKKGEIKIRHIYKLINVKTGEILPKTMEIETFGDILFKLFNENLVMSDKSATIYFFDIKNFIMENGDED